MLDVILKVSSITALPSAQGSKELSVARDYRQMSPEPVPARALGT